MKCNYVNGFGWGWSEKEKSVEEAILETDENKRNTCPQYLRVIPSAVLFFVLYSMRYFILVFFLSRAGFFLLTLVQGQSSKGFFIPGTHHIREFSKQGCNLLKTFQDCVCTAVSHSAEEKNHLLSAICRLPMYSKKLEVGSKFPQERMSHFQ